jgi:hypothetical protein
VRYTREVQEGELFAVYLVQTAFHNTDPNRVQTRLNYAVGWDPEDGLVCVGHPTVMVYNMSPHVMEVVPGDIVVRVCPMQEETRYYTQKEAKLMAQEGRLPAEKVVNSTTAEKPSEELVVRPAVFPEHLWDLVSPQDRRGVPAIFGRYKEEDLIRNIDEILYDLGHFSR